MNEYSFTGCANIQRCVDTPEDPLAEVRTLTFDAIAICTGTCL
jgi:hypothetical protein